MSCAQIALNREGVEYDKYFASEVDKYAIKVTQANYPNTIQLGCITELTYSKLFKNGASNIDLLIGGSPCQGFSFAGKQLNFDDPRSRLFFEYVRILHTLKEINPDIKFILENVKMKKEFQDAISKFIGVEPIEINSNLVSAQNRRRLYWTNIPHLVQPLDKQIMLEDIVHEGYHVDRDKSHAIIGSIGRTTEREYFQKKQGQMAVKTGRVFGHGVDREKSHCIDANYWKGGNFKSYFEKHRRQLVFEALAEYHVPFDKTLQIMDKEVARGKVGYFNADSQANRVYYIHDKAVTLCGDAGGGSAKMGQYLFGCITPDRVNKRQNGQRFSEGKKFYTLTAQDQHGILIEGYIRKLTPMECERLQTVPEDYTNHVSNTQRYKMLGNGMTVDVIAHILNFMPVYAPCGCLEEDVHSYWCDCCQVTTVVCHHNSYGTCMCS
jgi:DNA (cytosine-5)-methyltransferase 3A